MAAPKKSVEAKGQTNVRNAVRTRAWGKPL
jgi:hypothetical protein